MDFPELKLLLTSPESKSILKALIDIRTRVVKSNSGLQGLLEQNFVSLLVSLLNRSNSKIIDVSLSILANLLQEEVARQKIRACGGLAKLMHIVDNIDDTNILCRAWRAVANAAQDSKNINLLHQLGLASHLSKALTSLTDDSSRVVLVRCVRIAGDTDRHRGYLVEEGALEGVVNTLLSLDEDSNPDLYRTVAKCLAKLSHGARLEEAEIMMPGLDVLVRIANGSLVKREVSDNCLGALVNLSQLNQLRPSLGNTGVVELLVKSFDSCEKNSKLKNSVITALCLYCRESVNRVKLREVGGCKLFVQVLSSKEEEMVKLQDMVLNSMLQFIYDNRSLNVLMSEGFIPSLVQMLEEHTSSYMLEHKCETTGNEEKQNEEEEEENEIAEEAEIEDEPEVESIDPTDNLEVKVNVEASISEVSDDVVEPPKSESGPVFRITSPSYQAVQYELEQFMQLRNNMELNTSGAGSPRWPASSYSGGPSSPLSPPSSPPEWTPLSPSSSFCMSPDRSPPQLSCGFSPTGSDTGHSPAYSSCSSPSNSRTQYSPMLYSPSASPPYSPAEPNYSPIENFSDEECEVDENDDDETIKKNPIALNEPRQSLKFSGDSEPVVSTSSSSIPLVEIEEKLDVPGPSTAKGPETKEIPSFIPWTKRTLKIQRTHTYLGQTFTLPPRTRSPSPPLDCPAKRPKLCPSPYKYSASPLPSQKTSSTLPRQLSRLAVGPPPKVKKTGTRISWIMQILSRLSLADRPHADLTSARTIKSIFSYMSLVHSGIEISGKILTRISTNLYCLFPFLLGRHFSYLSLAVEDLDLSTTVLGCVKCRDNYQEVKKLIQTVGHNLTLLAETGFGEGEICHRLVLPVASKEDKQAITLSTAMLVRQRKMLRNILINHDSLDLLLDILEAGEVTEAVDDKPQDTTASSLFSQAVLSVSHMAGHLGVVCPSISLNEENTGQCCMSYSEAEDNLTLIMDDGTSLTANKEILCDSCPVFAAMFSGSFSESGQSSIPLPQTSSPALSCLLHYLYGCRLCPQFSSLSVQTLLELVSLSDKYLLPELNMTVNHCIIRRCVSGPDLVELYRLALQKKYPVQCAGNPGTLAQSTVYTVLVGDMPNRDRVDLVRRLVSSQLSGDFIDDVSKLLRVKLLERA